MDYRTTPIRLDRKVCCFLLVSIFKVGVCLQVSNMNFFKFSGGDRVLQIWGYEGTRLFRDRLVTQDDKNSFDNILNTTLRSDWSYNSTIDEGNAVMLEIRLEKINVFRLNFIYRILCNIRFASRLFAWSPVTSVRKAVRQIKRQRLRSHRGQRGESVLPRATRSGFGHISRSVGINGAL